MVTCHCKEVSFDGGVKQDKMNSQIAVASYNVQISLRGVCVSDYEASRGEVRDVVVKMIVWWGE